MDFIKRQPPVRIIAVGFAVVILLGSLLLSLPFSVRSGVSLSYVDALYTSVSAVCVTGLATVDVANTFTVAGQVIIALLIQTGGLGITSIGAAIVMIAGKKMDLKSRNLIRESMNFDSGRGVIRFLRSVLLTTILFELVGAVLNFFVFIKDFPLPKAIGLSIFHAVSAFNNAGFDLLGNFESVARYYDDVYFNVVTCLLIFLGGIGFLVIRECVSRRFRWNKLSMHSRVVLSVSAVLIVAGTLLFKLTEDISWTGAFFASVSARTAGFATMSLDKFSNAGLLVMMALMFIGASPGSTGGGIKTGTFFVLVQGIKSSATNKSEKAFNYKIPRDAFKKAAVITIFALSVVIVSTFLVLLLEPDIPFADVLFEMTSAMGTVGLSTGITPSICTASKIITMLVMYIGRMGAWSIVSLWSFSREERISYPEGNISVG